MNQILVAFPKEGLHPCTAEIVSLLYFLETTLFIVKTTLFIVMLGAQMGCWSQLKP